jgi:hypothetical protein
MSSDKLSDAIESWIDSLPDVEQQLINAKRRAKLLEEGPGGIMEMKQTIANKEIEIDRLQKYKFFAIMIANEPSELSYEKIKNQRDWWKLLARELIEELENDDE